MTININNNICKDLKDPEYFESPINRSTSKKYNLDTIKSNTNPVLEQRLSDCIYQINTVFDRFDANTCIKAICVLFFLLLKRLNDDEGLDHGNKGHISSGNLLELAHNICYGGVLQHMSIRAYYRWLCNNWKPV